MRINFKTMKKLSIILISLILFSCSKQAIEKGNQLSFDLNGKHYNYNDVRYSAEPFCGSTLYSMEGIQDSSRIFLISIVSDSLPSGIYDAGANFWDAGFSAISNPLKIAIDNNKQGFTASFYGTFTSLGRSYSLTNGSLTINNN